MMDTGSKKKLQGCPNCGHTPLRDETITDRFEYCADGEDAIMIEAHDVPVQACPNCGEKYLGAAARCVQHAAVCRALGLLTPEEIQVIRERFGPTQAEFARLTGIGEATISRWERGRMLPNRAMDRYLRLLDRNSANVQTLKTIAEAVPPFRELAPAPNGGQASADVEGLVNHFRRLMEAVSGKQAIDSQPKDLRLVFPEVVHHLVESLSLLLVKPDDS